MHSHISSAKDKGLEKAHIYVCTSCIQLRSQVIASYLGKNINTERSDGDGAWEILNTLEAKLDSCNGVLKYG